MIKSEDSSKSATPELIGKVAVITGSGRGIGEAIALAYAKQSATLVLVSRTASELAAVANKVRRLGASATVIAGDVSKPDDVTRTIDTTLDMHGSVDILVNAAAIHGSIGYLWEADVESWISAVRVNLVGTFLCCRAAIPHMIAKRTGKIINFSGGGATSPSPYMSAYGASKAAIARMTETLAVELSDFNVQVNAIAPGIVDTQIHEGVLAASNVPAAILEPVRRLKETGQGGVPRELPAALAVFLASSRSGTLSGKLISAPHDDWEAWDSNRIRELMSDPWLTIRRMDRFTLRPLLDQITS